MHHREAHKSIAITKQVSQTCSLTQHHYHKRPLSLKIPAAAIWLLHAGNNCFSNAVRILPFCKYCICTGHTQILQTQLQPSTQNLEQARFPGRGTPAQPSPRRVHSLCSSRWGRTGRRCSPQCQHCVTQGWWSLQIPWRDSSPDALRQQPTAWTMPGTNMS